MPDPASTTNSVARSSSSRFGPLARIVVIGGGGHGAVITEAAELAGHAVVGVLDDKAEPALSRPRDAGGYAIQHLGNTIDLDDVLDRLIASAPPGLPRRVGWVLGIGELTIRRRILESIRRHLDLGVTVVHPSAFVASTASIGLGVYVGPLAVVNSRATLEDHAIVNSGAIIEHDSVVGRNSHAAPGSVLAGYTRIGSGTLVGMNASVLPGVRIGDNALAAAGAVIRSNVRDGAEYAGVPAVEIVR